MAEEWVELVDERTSKTCFFNPLANATTWTCPKRKKEEEEEVEDSSYVVSLLLWHRSSSTTAVAWSWTVLLVICSSRCVSFGCRLAQDGILVRMLLFWPRSSPITAVACSWPVFGGTFLRAVFPSVVVRPRMLACFLAVTCWVLVLLEEYGIWIFWEMTSWMFLYTAQCLVSGGTC